MNKPILEIISVTYGHGFKLKCFIDSIRSQTIPNWRLHIIHDGSGEIFNNLKEDLSINGYLNDSRIVLSATETRTNNWGHPLREYGLQNRISDAPYITITNCDNYYIPVWVSYIYNLANQDKDFIYWNCVHDHREYAALNCQLKRRWIDMGCVAVKSSIATEVGFPFRDFGGDWMFFEECLKHISPDKIHKISKFLLVHN